MSGARVIVVDFERFRYRPLALLPSKCVVDGLLADPAGPVVESAGFAVRLFEFLPCSRSEGAVTG